MGARATTTPHRTAIVLGASGSVGGALVQALVTSGAFCLVSLTRRAQPAQQEAAARAGVPWREVLLDPMDVRTLEAAAYDGAMSAPGEVVGLSVLGIGAGTARLSIEQHRAVDVALNGAFARGLARSPRAHQLVLMSAVGANACASTGGSGAAGTSRYNRVKGEAEHAARVSGVPVVSIVRPSLIIGSAHTPRVLERLLPLLAPITPTRFRSITVEQIARAMVALAQHPPAESAVYHYAEMRALGERR